jgi:uncharacterized protein YjeT (DUF2065 family)
MNQPEVYMNRTRLSLYYLASYLWGGGIGLLIVPQVSATLLQSNANYPDVMLRTLGMFMIVLGIMVVQIIRHRIEILYPATLIARAFICICFIAFFFIVRDPFFLVLLGIVGLGVLLTGSSYFSEKEKRNET